jgi:hypothetical protein
VLRKAGIDRVHRQVQIGTIIRRPAAAHQAHPLKVRRPAPR